jgi:hypothetical protein
MKRKHQPKKSDQKDLLRQFIVDTFGTSTVGKEMIKRLQEKYGEDWLWASTSPYVPPVLTQTYPNIKFIGGNTSYPFSLTGVSGTVSSCASTMNATYKLTVPYSFSFTLTNFTGTMPANPTVMFAALPAGIMNVTSASINGNLVPLNCNQACQYMEPDNSYGGQPNPTTNAAFIGYDSWNYNFYSGQTLCIRELVQGRPSFGVNGVYTPVQNWTSMWVMSTMDRYFGLAGFWNTSGGSFGCLITSVPDL